jgi:hypothetical protein
MDSSALAGLLQTLRTFGVLRYQTPELTLELQPMSGPISPALAALVIPPVAPSAAPAEPTAPAAPLAPTHDDEEFDAAKAMNDLYSTAEKRIAKK